MSGARIASRAAGQIGVPFRLHAKLPGTALDCVGLVAHAAQLSGKFEYQLRGDFTAKISEHLQGLGFALLNGDAPILPGDFLPGDIVMAQTATRQQHLMIYALGGFIHAHAGLGQVVLMPAPSPWPILCGWRDRR